MMIQSFVRSGMLAAGLTLAVGCSGTDGSDGAFEDAQDEVTEEEAAEENASEASPQQDLGANEQAILLPIVEPGPAGQCVAACTRFETSVALQGQCCLCNGELKTFQRASFNQFLYLCR